MIPEPDMRQFCKKILARRSKFMNASKGKFSRKKVMKEFKKEFGDRNWYFHGTQQQRISAISNQQFDRQWRTNLKPCIEELLKEEKQD